MISSFLSFFIGCCLTYLVTIFSSAVRSSEILENAMLTYAIMLMSIYDISVQQLEQAVIANEVDPVEARTIRRIHKAEFEAFANKNIKELLKRISPTHENIIRYKNFKDLEVYITNQFRRQHAKSNQKR
jgi:hypothetical protein